MNVSIIIFSPTGNTNLITRKIKTQLDNKNIAVNLLSITGKHDYFQAKNKMNYLNRNIQAHEVLLIGGPVYAHHLQYHVKELLRLLPKPDTTWGKHAIPFVTYGGVSSGIALEEAGKLLKKSGRTVLCGIKVSMPHHALKILADVDFNCMDDSIIDKTIIELTDIITSIRHNPQPRDPALKYRSRMEYIIDNIIFNEKKWHAKHYPKISINRNQCTLCKQCIKACPVGHLQFKNGLIIENENNPCIHCTNCVSKCPANAMSLSGNIEKIKEFINKLIRKGPEQPGTCVIQ